MPDDKTKPRESSKIDLGTDYEVQYWMERFSCTKEDLQRAVNLVGTSAEKVEEHLKRGKAA